MYKLILIMVFGLALNVAGSTFAAQREEPIKLEVMSRDNIDRIQQVATIEANAIESVIEVKFSPDSNLMALRDQFSSEQIELWNINPPSLKHVLMPENDDIIWRLNLSYDGQAIAIEQSNFIQLWDTATGDTRFVIEEDHSINISKFAPHTGMLAYVLVPSEVTVDREYIYLWDVERDEEIALLSHPTVLNFAFSYEGDYLASVGTDGSIRLWNLNEGELGEAFELVREADGQSALQIEFVGDSSIYFQIGYPPVSFNVWDYKNSELTEIDYLGFPISRDVFATPLPDNKYQLWDVNSGSNLALLDLGTGLHVSGTPDQRVFATSLTHPVQILDVETGEVLKTLTCEQLCRAVFSDDGRYLAIWSAGNTVSLWGVTAEE